MSSRALRKKQNDEELLESILQSSAATSKSSSKHTTPRPQGNLFALMNDDNELSDCESEPLEEKEEEKEDELKESIPISNSVKLQSKAQRKKNKKNKKKKGKQQKEPSDEGNNLGEKDDEEFDKLLLEFQAKTIKDSMKNIDNDSDEYFSASEVEFIDTHETDESEQTYIKNDLKYDCGFSKFPYSCLAVSTRFFNTDFKLLDPHTEFKLLFDDISAESMEDIESLPSSSISPQQLKQIQRMRRLVRNWDGKDHRNVPNGPGGSVHRLQFTKIRNDWLPTPRGELSMKLLTNEDVMDWQLWQRPTEWKDMITDDIARWRKVTSFYKFEPLNSDLNKKAMTEFYLNVILHPDHEALINSISLKFPYHVPGLLQVALIAIRQGDKSNTNGLLQRALFVFDRALKTGIRFDAVTCQLPYIYFFNRQFYLAIFRYISSLAQRGAIGTAGEWCKTLWSLSPLEDPLGCRYFIDHYLLLNKEYKYLIELSRSPLMTKYRQWYTLGLSMGATLSYIKISDIQNAKKELRKCFIHHPLELAQLYVEKLAGDMTNIEGLDISGKRSELLELKVYLTRFPLLWKDPSDISFLSSELTSLFRQYQDGVITIPKIDNHDDIESPLFIDEIPVNLLRFAILSEESTVMAAIPKEIWSDYQVFEFDVLPPTPISKETLDVVESIKSFINEKELVTAQAEQMQDEDLLNQIRQLSLNQYIAENEIPRED